MAKGADEKHANAFGRLMTRVITAFRSPVAATPTIDQTPYGRDLAQQVVEVLKHPRDAKALNAIVRDLKEYCGHGLFHDLKTGEFFLSEAADGLPYLAPLKTFSAEGDFIDWLAQ